MAITPPLRPLEAEFSNRILARFPPVRQSPCASQFSDLLGSKASLGAEKKYQTISDGVSTAVEMEKYRFNLSG